MSEEISQEAESEVATEQPEGSSETTSEGDLGVSKTSEEAQTTGTSSSKDWWDTSDLDPKGAERVRQIQAEFTRKSQQAAKAQTLEQQIGQYQSMVNQYQEEMRRALENPDYYNNARNRYYQDQGLTPEQAKLQPPKLTKLESLEDLEKYQSEMAEYMEKKISKQLEERFEQRVKPVAETINRQKWESAHSKMQGKFGDLYDRYSNQTVTSILNGPFRSLLSQGLTEEEVLEIAFLKLAHGELQNNARQEGLQSIHKKKLAATEKPGKPIKTAAPKAKSKEEIIAEIRSLGLSFDKR